MLSGPCAIRLRGAVECCRCTRHVAAARSAASAAKRQLAQALVVLAEHAGSTSAWRRPAPPPRPPTSWSVTIVDVMGVAEPQLAGEVALGVRGHVDQRARPHLLETTPTPHGFEKPRPLDDDDRAAVPRLDPELPPPSRAATRRGLRFSHCTPFHTKLFAWVGRSGPSLRWRSFISPRFFFSCGWIPCRSQGTEERAGILMCGPALPWALPFEGDRP